MTKMTSSRSSPTSSSDLAISVRGLSKSYTIRHQEEHHITLAEQLLHRARHPLSRQERETFWALRDVSFDVRSGEVLGVIGRNGAGKSTLLKLLSRITPPTRGEVRLYGRVGSLLEVGTGFHPELTGRENVYLNGAILGMRSKEIDRRFDEIVAFAGVEQFLDTPVKRFSSGMYVRLAFAVAAHLDTEILLVDEVLSVGDADFQARCGEKIREVAQDGRAVLLVSHQMRSIAALCDQVAVFSDGELVTVAHADVALSEYLRLARSGPGTDDRRRTGSGELRIRSVDAERESFGVVEPKAFHFSVEVVDDKQPRFFVSAVIHNTDGAPIAHIDSNTLGIWYEVEARGSMMAGRFALDQPWLHPGNYWIDVHLCNAGVIDSVYQACWFTVLPDLPYASPPGEELLRRDATLPAFRFEVLPVQHPPFERV